LSSSFNSLPSSSAAPAVTSAGASSVPPIASPSPLVTPTPSEIAQPHAGGFTVAVTTVTAADLGASWHAGCPVGPNQLRAVTLGYWGFDGAAHTGTLVVSSTVVPAVTRIFRTLFDERFPIRSMLPTSEFGGSDDASMAVDNTSAFNCRYAVAAGPPQWSAHAFGKAIDVNTVENPYVFEGKVLPPQGTPFVARTPYRPGMAVRGGALVNAFGASGWQWGGRWSAPDYQHFSADGG
jgi:hypothetical protein